MAAKIIDGSALASEIRRAAQKRLAALKKKGVNPKLAIIIASRNTEADMNARSMLKALDESGIVTELFRYPDNVPEDEILRKIKELNNDPKVHGILIELPMPERINKSKVSGTIRPEKDIDCLSPENYEKLAHGEPTFEPCAPRGVMAILERNKVSVNNKKVVVIDNFGIFGRPMSDMAAQLGGDCMLCNSRTSWLKSITLAGDIIVCAAGRPGFLKETMVKSGSAVIDAGANRMKDGSVTGDVDFELVKEKAGLITPVPGGLGPVTVAMLIENVVKAAEKSQKA